MIGIANCYSIQALLSALVIVSSTSRKIPRRGWGVNPFHAKKNFHISVEVAHISPLPTNHTTYAPLNTPKNPIDPTLNHRIPRPGRASTGASRMITK